MAKQVEVNQSNAGKRHRSIDLNSSSDHASLLPHY